MSRFLLVFVFLGILSCGQENKSNLSSLDERFTQGYIRGHEEITRFAVDIVNAETGDLFQSGFLFPIVNPGESGNKSKNLLVRGNYATDFPRKVEEYSLTEFYGEDPSNDISTDGKYQMLHFLRNYPTPSIDSAEEACFLAREAITKVAQEAIKNFNLDNEKFLFFLGHALHIIQDSFAAAHVKRSEDFLEIKDICVYNMNVTGVCKHKWVDPLDLILISNCQSKGWECLRPEAQKASIVSAGFLKTISKILVEDSSPTNVEKEMIEFFENPMFIESSSGYFQCKILP